LEQETKPQSSSISRQVCADGSGFQGAFMGRDIIDMVDIAIFLGIVMLGCVTVLLIGLTFLLMLMGWDLAISLWDKIKT
jgi:hypothetical protein